ncbi:nuclear protein DGCR14 [Elsinoe ampelina]|uniref:Nuclear protein DGCR14 n=1 Tax=Elsinoe ampelina TaxID=302913 RepID=A0A6A6G0V5_9PEZI|nr:nuclear protein DGCR14 [Elsinoe ampelina]
MERNSQSNALAKRKADADMALMPPPLPPKRTKRPSTVLDEDVYTDALSRVIARDFFPGLLEIKAQQEYLDALDSKDDEWIREAGNNLKVAMTPDPYRSRRDGMREGSIAQTPASVATTATPGRTPLQRSDMRDPSATPAAKEEPGPRQPKVDLSLSLTDFQSKYTSEDNESFNGVLDAQNLAKAKKYAFLRNNTNKLPSKQQIAQQKLLTNGESTVLSSPAVASTTIAKPTPREPQTSLIPRPSQDLDARPASVDSFPVVQGAKNTFMFYPESIEDDMTTLAQRAEAESLAPPRVTNFAATRMPGPEAERPAVPPSPSMSAVDAAIAGKPRLSASEVGSTMGDGYYGAETPQVKGWKFVDAEPTRAEEMLYSGKGTAISDVEAQRQERAEIMKLLPKAESGGFQMNATSSRDELRDRMVEKNERAKRKSRPEQRVRGDLTPAGRSLAGRLGTPGRTPGSGMFGGGGGASKAWTPMRTPGVKR